MLVRNKFIVFLSTLIGVIFLVVAVPAVADDVDMCLVDQIADDICSVEGDPADDGDDGDDVPVTDTGDEPEDDEPAESGPSNRLFGDDAIMRRAYELLCEHFASIREEPGEDEPAESGPACSLGH